ncbi:hypothetical protein AAGW05_07835 [Arthrobacter sp. LAPM80]|uniref:hypothetical protein n=1 Tax=Arthrobacter sp. LAPM80 TaxID=3141788 RepID=UPI00398B997F
MDQWLGFTIAASGGVAAVVAAVIELVKFTRDSKKKRLEFRIVCGRKGHNFPGLHTAAVILVNPCKSSIKTSDFDGGKPLRIRLGTALVDTLIPPSIALNWPGFQIVGAGEEEGMAIMQADLIPPLASIHGFVFTANPPMAKNSPSLGDIPVHSGTDASSRRRKLKRWACVMIILAVFWAVIAGMSWLAFAVNLWAFGEYAQVLAKYLVYAAGMGFFACLALLTVAYLRDHVLDRHINQQVAKFESILDGSKDYFDPISQPFTPVGSEDDS